MEEIKLRQFKEKMELFGYAYRTVESYINDMRLFCRYLEEVENVKTLAELEEQHIKAWQVYLTFGKFRDGKNLTSGTVVNRLRAVKTFFQLMHRENLCPVDYGASILIPKARKPLPKNIPSADEMRRLLKAAEPDSPIAVRDRLMMELMYATGIRSEELRQLNLQRMNVQERTLFITGKGSKDRVVPIGEWVLPYALEYLHSARNYLTRLKDTGLLFPTKNGWQLDGSGLHKIIKGYKNKAGLTMRISPHTFRHACATHMIQAGADIRYVQELLGHSTLDTTQIYTRVSIKELKEAHRKFHPGNREDF